MKNAAEKKNATATKLKQKLRANYSEQVTEKILDWYQK